LLDKNGFLGHLQRAGAGPQANLQESKVLSGDYLGYVVIRPIPSVPIGRTALSPLYDDPARKFPTLVKYPVHLAGLELTVNALAFQQQDVGVSACATTAIWSALQRVAKADGFRAPTPSDITESAVRFVVEGRAYPQKGLTLWQMCEAVRSSGFAPYLMKAGENPDALLLSLQAALESRIPTILIALSENLGHAVTAVGYRSGTGTHVPRYSVPSVGVSFGCPGAAVGTLYVHDDRLGPYARVDLLRRPPSWAKDPEVRKQCPFTLQTSHGASGPEELGLFASITPLYQKIRITPEEMYANSAFFAEYFKLLLNNQDLQHINLEVRFAKSGEYAGQLLNYGKGPGETFEFLQQSAFSRYVGILRFLWDSTPLFETIWDTTDTGRSGSQEAALLGVVCFEEVFRPTLGALVRNQYKSLML